MANHRACETGKRRYQQVISIIGSLLSVNNSSSPFITGRRLCWIDLWQRAQDQLSHLLPKHTPHVTQLATRGFWVNLHPVIIISGGKSTWDTMWFGVCGLGSKWKTNNEQWISDYSYNAGTELTDWSRRTHHWCHIHTLHTDLAHDVLSRIGEMAICMDGWNLSQMSCLKYIYKSSLCCSHL